MSEDLHTSDVVLWSERQAEALRRLRAGERVNDLDWDNLIEEVESLGRSETRGVRTLLVRALEHLLKAAAWRTRRTRPRGAKRPASSCATPGRIGRPSWTGISTSSASTARRGAT